MTPLPILGWWLPHPYLADDPPTHTCLMTPPTIVGWWPPYPYLADNPPTHTWLITPPTHTWLITPPHPYLADDPPYPYLPHDPPHIWLMTPLPILAWWPPPNGWMMCWVKLVLVLYVWRQDRMRPAQQGLPFILFSVTCLLHVIDYWHTFLWVLSLFSPTHFLNCRVRTLPYASHTPLMLVHVHNKGCC